VLCAVTITSSADLLSLHIYLVCGRMFISSIVCVLGAIVSGRSVCELFTNRPSTHKSTKHTQIFNERKSAEDIIVTAQTRHMAP
jgi:hypothetical protein